MTVPGTPQEYGIGAGAGPLLPATTYHFRLVATNAVGTTLGEDKTFTTPAAPLPPTVVTGAASGVGLNSATLNGTVNPNGVATSYAFEYGTDTTYGSSTAYGSAGSGSSATDVSAGVPALLSGTTYHFRIVGFSTAGVSYGDDQMFTTDTPSTSPSAVTDPATDIVQDAASLNATINAHGASTTYTFEYGLTDSYGSTTSTSAVVNGTTDTPVSLRIHELTPATTYHYRVTATNINGTTTGADRTFTTNGAPPPPATAPSAITDPASTVAPGSAELNATVTANGAATSVHFEYGTTTAYGTSTTPVDIGSGTQPTDVGQFASPLQPGTTYHFQVVATNSEGTAFGADRTFTTPAAAPSVTTGGGTSVSSTGTTLNGTVNPNGADTTYYFQYGLNANDYTVATSSGSAGGGTSAIDASAAATGLQPGTTYHFQIVAMNSSGTSFGADHVFTTGAAAPSVVTGNASDITTDSATLNGTVTSNGDDTSYYFEYGTTDGYGQVTGTGDAGPEADGLPVSAGIEALEPGTTYHFRIVGFNGSGTTPGEDQIFTTDEPAAVPPSAVTGNATDINDTTATVHATVNPNGAATSYHFEYGTTASYGTSTAAVDVGDGTEAIDVASGLSGLAPDTTYHFFIVATNGAGSAFGADQTFTTGPAPVEPATAPAAVTGTGDPGDGHDRDPDGNGHPQRCRHDRALRVRHRHHLRHLHPWSRRRRRDD